MRDRHNSNPTNQPPWNALRAHLPRLYSPNGTREWSSAISPGSWTAEVTETRFKNLFRWTHETARDRPDAQTTAPLPRAADPAASRRTGHRSAPAQTADGRDAWRSRTTSAAEINVIYTKQMTCFHPCPNSVYQINNSFYYYMRNRKHC